MLGDKNILLKNPEMVAQDGALAFKTGLWFWMTPQVSDVITLQHGGDVITLQHGGDVITLQHGGDVITRVVHRNPFGHFLQSTQEAEAQTKETQEQMVWK